MNRFLSLFLSFFDDIITLLIPSKRGGFITVILMIAANLTPAIGVLIFGWNPFIILFFYWFESAIIGILNIFKMLISGAIQNGKFSPEGFSTGLSLSAFFAFHYGMFMLVHGIFLTVFFILFTQGSLFSTVFDEFNLRGLFTGFIPESMTAADILDSGLFPVASMLIYQIINFFIHFILTGEFDQNDAKDYMMRPYKRIVIMQLTIIFGAFALFSTGLKNFAFIIVWIVLKLIADLKLTAGEPGFAKAH